MGTRLLLATTAGPVRVERLTRERAQQSAVCLGRTTRVLAVSADYDAFVRQPSGVIEREFEPPGPGAFRLDVSGPIDEGDSWQLGVFAAHMLADAGGLAGPGDTADQVVWLTGAVHNDLTVETVDHIPEKLQASREAFLAIMREGVPLTLVLPKGSKVHARVSELPPEIRIIEVGSTGELGPILNIGRNPLTAGRAPGVSLQPRRPGPARRAVRAVAAAILVAIAAGALLAWQETVAWRELAAAGVPVKLADALENAGQSGWPHRRVAAALFRRGLASDRPTSDDFRLTIHERRAPAGRTCAAVHFGNVDALLQPVEPGPTGAYPPSTRHGLCGLEYSLAVARRPLYAAVAFEPVSGRYIEARPIPAILSGRKSWTGVNGWAIDLPWGMSEPLAYRLVLALSSYPVDDGSGAWRTLSDAKSGGRLAALGLLVVSVEHRVEP